MKAQLTKLKRAGWLPGAAAPRADFSAVETQFSHVLPPDYRQFMTMSNGGEGQIGENYLSLWKIEDVIRLNAEYRIQQYLKNDVVAFGSDGGGDCFCFDFSGDVLQPRVMQVPFGDLDGASMLEVADTFVKFVERAFTSSWVGDQ